MLHAHTCSYVKSSTHAGGRTKHQNSSSAYTCAASQIQPKNIQAFMEKKKTMRRNTNKSRAETYTNQDIPAPRMAPPTMAADTVLV